MIETNRQRVAALALAVALAFGCTKAAGAGGDPLPSWNDTRSKKAIVAFVERVTSSSSPELVPAAERVATFDNDGTLWGEKPLPVELYFTIQRVKDLAPQHPEWKTKEPFASLLKGDLRGALAAGEKGVVELLVATHTGMTTAELAQEVQGWIAAARHPRTGRLFTDMAYQPMLELLAYLRANGFKTFIVSGGGAEFMRPWTDAVYGVPPEQVVGSTSKLAYEERPGAPVLVKLAAVELVDDEDGKPVGIESHIGRHPIAAFGNSDGDRQMLEWATAGDGARFALLVHHDDERREYAYDREDQLARLDKAWNEAVARGWTVVSMKNDWRTIYPPR